MRNILLGGGVIIAIIIAVAIGLALKFGEQSPIIAQGTIDISPDLRADPNGYQALFITVFDPASPAPMPYGAMRQKAGQMPMHFTITKERLQIMHPDAPMPQHLRIKARLDVDGQGGMDQPGDLVGELPQVALGSKDNLIHINKKIRE